IALTEGPEHALVYANLAFRALTHVGAPDLGRPLADALAIRDTSELSSVLDQVYVTGTAARDGSLPSGNGEASWHYTVWPEWAERGRTDHLVVSLWESSSAELALSLQREVAERMLLTSLRELDASDRAEKSSRRATILASEGRRLAESLDEQTTWDAVARLALPTLGDWCIVDVLGDKGGMRRLRIVHPDPARQERLRELEDLWCPESGDPFGLPAVLQSRESTLIDHDVDAALIAGAHDERTLGLLRSLDIGSMLTVPLVIRESLLGALSFVIHSQHSAHSRDENALAEDFAVRSAMALESAKLHGEALEQRGRAEIASNAKTAFLATMSHELRTPLNAIGGYVDLILLGLRGPVSEEQQVDLLRIRRNQRHLLGLITDLLNFVRLGSGHVSYQTSDLVAHEAVAQTVNLIVALITEKGIVCDLGDPDPTIVGRADPEKVQQILINLFSNAIKFTPAGGRITVNCEALESTIRITVADTGIGIPSEKLEAIFDPFVQVKEGFAGRDTGVGLGLAISRELARAMHGDLFAQSELGRGSCFTLVMPKA
ncbi:MAG: GAF domain-containing sensor histidine kinase, partial [Gemmatimonadales bacterium]